jgi:predicted ArsR family transcriptional regulator
MSRREEILHVLGQLDQAIATIDLAKLLSIDPNSVRRYLEELRAQGMIKKKIERRPRMAFNGAMVGRQKVATWRISA